MNDLKAACFWIALVKISFPAQENPCQKIVFQHSQKIQLKDCYQKSPVLVFQNKCTKTDIKNGMIISKHYKLLPMDWEIISISISFFEFLNFLANYIFCGYKT